jgi:3'-phosphoadenosine 5'-phosphosulfate sulfotransferase
MGIIIGDTIELANGLNATNTYGTIGAETVSITKERIDNMTRDENGEETNSYTFRFRLRGRGVIWASKDFRNQHRPKLKHENIQVNFDDDTFLTQNVYTLLYNQWKTNYTTVTDDL